MDIGPVSYWRHPLTTIVSHRSVVSVIRRDGQVAFLRENVDTICRMLKLLREPCGLPGIAYCLGQSTQDVWPVLKLLVDQEAVLCVGDMDLRQENIRVETWNGSVRLKEMVFGISGTIQASTILRLASMLKGRFAAEVNIVLTPTATRFLRPEVASYLGLPVWSDVFEVRGEVNVPHIHLAQKADLVVIMPASATTIHRLATGACTDLLSRTVAATRAPILIAPAMNPVMWTYPPIDRNIEQLRTDGMYIVEPGMGVEVSNIAARELKFCGIGLWESNIMTTLEAVLNSATS